jgi:hypothetical protein
MQPDGFTGRKIDPVAIDREKPIANDARHARA